MDKTILFWILVGGLGFAFALAVQMRIIVALVLRRALRDWREDLGDRVLANQAVVLAASKDTPTTAGDAAIASAAEHLRATYPNPLGHLRTARRYSTLLPVLLIGVLVLGRLTWGVI